MFTQPQQGCMRLVKAGTSLKYHGGSKVKVIKDPLRHLFWTNGVSSIFQRTYHDDVTLPRISCPQKMVQRLEKHEKRRKDHFEAKRKRANHKGPLIISCKRKAYNFYAGQGFNENNVEDLVSCGWKNTKRVGDHFTLLAHSQNPSLNSDENGSSFEELGISTNLCSGLTKMGIDAPTEIQELAIPNLLQGDNVILAAETGSGKTLSYLLPCIEWILKRRETTQDAQVHCDSPSVVVITPNRELTSQVMDVAQTLVPYAEFAPQCSYSGYSTLRQEPLDMLITTPGNMNRLLQKKLIHGKQLQHIVIDESDTVLDDSFVDDVQAIFNRLNIIPAEEIDAEGSPCPFVGTQIALVSATMPRDIQESLGDHVSMESFTKVTTNALHRLPPHVSQKFIRINPDSKPEKLVHLLNQGIKKGEPALVFVKDNKTCFYVASMLREMGIDCLMLNGELSQKQRQGVFKKYSEGYSDVLVATDIASRGLDTVHVNHVINYDFPQHMSDYIHRVGRVGRVGCRQDGKVTSLISHKWDVDLLWKIEIAARKGHSLRDVNANIKQKLERIKGGRDRYELSVLP